MKFTALLAKNTVASVLRTAKVQCGGYRWTSARVKLWGHLCALVSTLLCLEFQQRKARVLRVGGSCDASQADVPPGGSVGRQRGAWLRFTVLVLCLLVVHLISWNIISCHEFRPFCKFLAGTSLNDLKEFS